MKIEGTTETLLVIFTILFYLNFFYIVTKYNEPYSKENIQDCNNNCNNIHDISVD